MKKQMYLVIVDDNFHFTDENERYKSGEYATYAEAIEKCKAIVDEYLESALEPGMTAKELYTSYQMFGEDPFIMGTKEFEFTSWDYARQRCEDLTSTLGS